MLSLLNRLATLSKVTSWFFLSDCQKATNSIFHAMSESLFSNHPAILSCKLSYWKRH